MYFSHTMRSTTTASALLVMAAVVPVFSAPAGAIPASIL